MPKKTVAKKVPSKIKRKNMTERGKEIKERKIKNATQKWFFSLEEKEQNFLETTYLIVVQITPELAWEDFLNRLMKTDKFNTGAKSIIKTAVGKF